MSDVMQFIRELLEGKPFTIGVRAVVTHVQKLPPTDADDPAIYLYQVEVQGFLYSDIACTRDPKLQNMQVGDEVITHMPPPETEGFPLFLLLSSVPEVQAEAQAKAATEVGTSDGVAVDDPPLEAFDPSAKDAEREETLATA